MWICLTARDGGCGFRRPGWRFGVARRGRCTRSRQAAWRWPTRGAAVRHAHGGRHPHFLHTLVPAAVAAFSRAYPG